MKKTIVKPHFTEKTLALASRGWYTFAAVVSARKEEIAHAISVRYAVTVVDIRTARMHGKMRRVGRAGGQKQKPDWKKAIVHLANGQHIDVFEVGSTPVEEPVKKERKK